MNRKEKLKKITEMSYHINEKLTNENLLDYIYDKFECIIDETFKIKEITNNYLKVIDKKQGSTFEITFKPNIENFTQIGTSYTCWNNQHIENKKIIFNDEKITIDETESTIYIYETGKVSSIEKRINKCEYQNNQLIYSYHFETHAGINLKNKLNGSTIEEMYILPDKSAVKYISRTGEENYFGTKGINYYKTENCDEPDFNTRQKNNKVYTYDFENADKEEYDDFVSTWKKEYKGTAKQKI